jgi:ketosteroid isomerase-like protein
MGESVEALIGRLFHAFNQRDEGTLTALCTEDMEMVAVTGAAAGHSPYRGREGLSEYLADVERIWEELLVTSSWIERRGDLLLVFGRVYLRSHEQGIRDLPVAWIWRLRAGRFVHGEVFVNPDEAGARFAAALA